MTIMIVMFIVKKLMDRKNVQKVESGKDSSFSILNARKLQCIL